LSATNDAELPNPPQRGHVGIYYCLALGISWAGWIPYGAQQAGVLHWQVPQALPFFAQYGPTFAALILIAVEGGTRGIAKFLATFVSFRAGPQWFAFTLLLPPAIAAVLIGLNVLHGTPVPTVASLEGWRVHMIDYLTGFSRSSTGLTHFLAQFASRGGWQAALVYVGLSVANGGISEEPGWRGYAFARLYPGRRAIVASLWVGVLWGFWHTGPDFWTAIFQSHWGAFFIPITYLVITLPLSILFSWVFIHSNGSLLPVILFHASYNATFIFLTAIWTPGKPVVSPPEWALAFLVVALLVVGVCRRSLFAVRQLAPLTGESLVL
jgi:membrane protease YdiL (CAAX protease family)